MLDDLMDSFEKAIEPRLNAQPYIDPLDLQIMQQDYAEFQRQQSEDARITAQDIEFQRRLQQMSDRWTQYLEGIDASQGNSFRSTDLAQLEADILAAEQRGWEAGLS